MVAESDPAEPFLYWLNTSTLRGQKLTIVEEVRSPPRSATTAIEPWIRELDDHVKAGGSLERPGQADPRPGPRVESAIGFFEWAVDDEAGRREGARRGEAEHGDGPRDRRQAARRPAGRPDRTRRASTCARSPIAIAPCWSWATQFGVTPQLEVWGFSKTLCRLGEAALVAIEAGHPSACILADVYHLYKGGSTLRGPAPLNGAAIHVFHMNDYPADPPRETINDARSRLSRRRGRPARRDPANPPRDRLPRDALARAVQPELLGAGRRRSSRAGAWRG